ncbi:MAG TPA: type I glyceraldehyde-3-phosphate dehydrogenase [Myxococcota bacterium]|nr:type I glyceraldehyde-3-phosphate dehydrogenase [Myxococcota bacterium]
MTARLAINGFGRIGRLVLRAARAQGLTVVAVNDLTDARTLAHLLKYDSVHGRFPGEVALEGDDIVIDGEMRVRVCSEREPAKLPWRSLGADIAIESTGRFKTREEASLHLDAGAGHVIVTAPSPDPDVTVVLGVNDGELDLAQHRVISNASCTTNCLAPVAKVIDDHFGIERGWMTTIHAYTNDQPILDTPHKDLRRARAGALSMIPTSTGAARALGLVLPQLKGKLDGYAMRVPTADVSAVDLSVVLGADTDAGAVNDALRKAADGPLSGILQVCDDPCVSIDFQGNPHSSIVDAAQTKVMDGRFAKLVSWYDNEWGYASRVVDLAARIAAG